MEPFLFNELWFRALVGITLGLVLGSFLTMLTYRLPRGLSIVMPPSSCPSCKTRLRPRDLIPVLSWAINRGQCRFCKLQISSRYILIELVMALASGLVLVACGVNWLGFITLGLITAIAALVIIRLEKARKP